MWPLSTKRELTEKTQKALDEIIMEVKAMPAKKIDYRKTPEFRAKMSEVRKAYHARRRAQQQAVATGFAKRRGRPVGSKNKQPIGTAAKLREHKRLIKIAKQLKDAGYVDAAFMVLAGE